MIRSLLFVLVLLSGCSMVPLFDGDDLAGWRSVGDANWRVEDDSIIADRGDGYLVSTHIHRHYKLVVEFFVEADVNSGVFVECQDATDISPINCYEINIWDNHPRQEYRTGAIVTHVSPLNKLHTVDRWNTYEIVVLEDELTVYLNGTLVSSIESIDKKYGRIALQRAGAGGDVRFREVTMVPL